MESQSFYNHQEMCPFSTINLYSDSRVVGGALMVDEALKSSEGEPSGNRRYDDVDGNCIMEGCGEMALALDKGEPVMFPGLRSDRTVTTEST